MNRTEMRRCGKRYASKDEAARSKRAIEQGATPGKCVDPECGGWHLTKPSAPRAATGSMQAAVALVLTGERTVAQAALECDVAPDRLESRAWAEAKRIVFERDHWTCQACGALAQDVQHIVPRGMGGTADPVIAFGRQNLISLCRPCHSTCEARDPEMGARRFWLRTPRDLGLPILTGSEDGYRPMWLLADGTPIWEDPNEVAA